MEVEAVAVIGSPSQRTVLTSDLSLDILERWGIKGDLLGAGMPGLFDPPRPPASCVLMIKGDLFDGGAWPGRRIRHYMTIVQHDRRRISHVALPAE